MKHSMQRQPVPVNSEHPLFCEGCGLQLKDLNRVVFAWPDTDDPGTIHPVHMWCVKIYTSTHPRTDLYPGPKSETLTDLVAGCVDAAIRYPCRTLEGTETWLGGRTLRYEVAAAAERVAQIYRGG